MKKVIVIILSFACIGLTSFCLRPKGDAFIKTEGTEGQTEMEKRISIKSGTSQINYIEFTNSGIATQTKYELYRDSLVWDYQEMRTGKHERRSVGCSATDFAELLQSLSAVKLSVKDLHDTSSGGDGFAYVFFQDGKSYLSFNSSFDIKGDFDTFSSLISQYIKDHPIVGTGK